MKRSLKLLLSGLLILQLISCGLGSKFEVFKGELTFGLVEEGSFYILKDGLGNQFQAYIDSLIALPPSTLSNNEIQFIDHYTLLQEHELLDQPIFNLKVENQTYTVYCDSLSIKRIRMFKSEELDYDKEKVIVEFIGEAILSKTGKSTLIIKCEDLVFISRVDN